jgi:cephalosporin hydroxylase
MTINLIKKRFLYLTQRLYKNLYEFGFFKTIKKIINFFFFNKIDLEKIPIDLNISLDEIFIKFGTDKGSLDGKKTYDFLYKNTNEFKNYYEWICRKDIKKYPYQLGNDQSLAYENIFKTRRFENLKILELGVANGHSIASWHHYFPNATIFALDSKKYFKFFYKSKRIKYINIDIFDSNKIKKFIKENQKFDFIIDDSLHTEEAMLTNIKNFYSSINSQGCYILEDFKSIDFFKKTVMKYNFDNKANYFVKNSVIMEEVFHSIKAKVFFDNNILDKKTLEYIFETAEDSYVVYNNAPWSSLGIIKKK